MQEVDIKSDFLKNKRNELHGLIPVWGKLLGYYFRFPFVIYDFHALILHKWDLLHIYDFRSNFND